MSNQNCPNLHFFKAYSRIGLKNPPHRKKEPNIGVEYGPEAILTDQFLSTIPNQTSAFYFSQPESLNNQEFNQVLAAEMAKFRDQILEDLKQDQLPVVVGGDHSVTFASMLASLQRWGNQNLGYLHIDSHPDANLAKTSPTQNFHGMYLRPLLADDFDIPEISSLVKQRFLPENILFVGNLDINPGERQLFEDLKIRKIAGKEISNDPDQILQEVRQFLNRFKYLHVNFDIDALDKSIAPGTGIPAEHGLKWAEIEPLLNIISTHPNLAFDLTEVNPQKDPSGKTVKVAQKILLSVLTK